MVLDDFDKFKATERTVQFLFELANAAYEGRLRLWLTTNADVRSLTRKINSVPGDYGEPIIRRLKETCDRWRG